MNSNSAEAKKYIKKQKIYKIKIIFSQILLLIGFIFLWEILSAKGIINSFLFSSPSAILSLLKQYLISGELFEHIYISVYETILGLIIGTSLGIIFGDAFTIPGAKTVFVVRSKSISTVLIFKSFRISPPGKFNLYKP